MYDTVIAVFADIVAEVFESHEENDMIFVK